MCKVPKTPKSVDPPPIDLPEIELGVDKSPGALRKKKARGRTQLQTGLNIPTGASPSVQVPTE